MRAECFGLAHVTIASLALAVALSSCDRQARSDGLSPDPSDAVFSKDRLLEVDVELAPADWEALRSEGRTIGILAEGCADTAFESPYNYFPGTVTIDGERLPRVGVRKKGFLGSVVMGRPSLKLRFNKFIERQHLAGMRRLTLNNDTQDPSHIKQCMAYKFFDEAGVPAPRCGFARVRVNGEDLGVYTTLEVYDERMLARHFPDGGGKLYEGQLSDFRQGWLQTFQAKSQKGVDERDELFALTRALRADDEDLLEQLEPLVDIDAFLSFWATESLIGHWDSYTGNTNNFFVYLEPTSGKFHFIPWGTDGSFSVNPFLDRPAPAAVAAFGMLANRLYGVRESRERYIARLRELLDTVWDEEAILAEVDRLEQLLGPHADAGKIDAFRTYVRERKQAIAAEINDGAPVWDFGLKSADVCWQTRGEVSASFSTSWGTLDAKQPVGEGSLRLVVDGEEEVFRAHTAGSGTSPLTTWSPPSVQLTAVRDDGSLLILFLILEERAFAPGTAAFHGFSTFAALVQIKDGASTNLGYISDGTTTFEAASQEVGAPVVGQMRGVWYSRWQTH